MLPKGEPLVVGTAHLQRPGFFGFTQMLMCTLVSMLFKKQGTFFGKCTGNYIEIPYLRIGLPGSRHCHKDVCYH